MHSSQLEAYRDGIATGRFSTIKSKIQYCLECSEIPLTAYELATYIDEDEATTRARITELVNSGILVHDTEKLSPKGTKQITYKIAEYPNPLAIKTWGKTKFDKLVITLQEQLGVEKAQYLLAVFEKMWGYV